MRRIEKERVLRLIEEIVNRGDLELVDELVHPDFFDHDAVASRAVGPAGFRATVRLLHESFAGFRMEPNDVIVAGRKVVARVTASGRHVGDLNGMPATGREWSAQQIHIFRLADGKVIEHWAAREDLRAMRQLGPLDDLRAAGATNRE